jgi:hypothetical protein
MADATNFCLKEKQGGMSQDIKLGPNVVELVRNILTILESDVLVVVCR